MLWMFALWSYSVGQIHKVCQQISSSASSQHHSNHVQKISIYILLEFLILSGADLKTFKPQLERFTSFPETFLENGVDFLHFLLG